MQLNTSPETSTSVLLAGLQDPPLSDEMCPRRTRLQIDLLLLAIEALDLGGSEALLVTARQLELKDVIQNRVHLWRMRSTNPLRRNASQRRPLSLTEAKALVIIICALAKRLTVSIRDLLLAYDQLKEKQVSLDQHLYLSTYLERFRSHFRARMNPKRAGVMVYDTNEKLNQLALSLLRQLLFCTGTSGVQRLWVSLFDGEVA